MPDANAPKINKGLDGIYVSESKICKVDGLNGKLYYRGYPIDDIAANCSFEEASYLILHGTLPNKGQLDEFSKSLSEERDLPTLVVDVIEDTASEKDPMHVLMSAVSLLPAFDEEADDAGEDANLRKSIRIISKMSSIVAAIGRYRNEGEEYVPPDKSLDHIENFMYMLNGKKPTKQEYDIMRIMFLLQLEHSSNASTFSAMVTGSSLSDIYSAVTSAIGTLKGPLHGEADEMALKMMEAIGNPDNTEKYIEDALAGKQRIMGFGHRIYKTYDPRAKILKKYLLELQEHSAEEVRKLTEIALRAEKMMIDKLGASHGIWPNVDFFAGPLYTAAGIQIDLFTPIFAASRATGWCAHLLEYWKENKLIRPLEYYTGPLDLKYLPIGERQ